MFINLNWNVSTFLPLTSSFTGIGQRLLVTELCKKRLSLWGCGMAASKYKYGLKLRSKHLIAVNSPVIWTLQWLESVSVSVALTWSTWTILDSIHFNVVNSLHRFRYLNIHGIIMITPGHVSLSLQTSFLGRRLCLERKHFYNEKKK